MLDYLEQLDRLADLRRKDVLSQEEFEVEKARILAARSTTAVFSMPRFAAFFRRPVVLTTIGIVVVAAAGGYWLKSGIRPTKATSRSPENSLVEAAPDQEILFELIEGRNCRFDPNSESFIERIQLASRSPTSDPERLLPVGPAHRQSEVRTRSDGDATISEVDVSLPWHGGTIRKIRLIDWPQGRGVVLAVRGKTEGFRWSGSGSADGASSGDEPEKFTESRVFQFKTEGGTRFACFAATNEVSTQS